MVRAAVVAAAAAAAGASAAVVSCDAWLIFPVDKQSARQDLQLRDRAG